MLVPNFVQDVNVLIILKFILSKFYLKASFVAFLPSEFFSMTLERFLKKLIFSFRLSKMFFHDI